ncbi:MAG TPA: DEAD/DEAH box helicase, partial [Leptospiraceae bacterium]|nr:DEAD/DEAH box helicase [Leptospiraceae bacterium]
MFSGWENLGEYLDSYTYRQSQEKFSDSIQRALADQAVLIGEAGTGTGKTIAYLIPLLLYAVETETRVAVSTDTKSLQTQLLTKDIPLVESILGLSPGAELCLGASNYICKRKMKAAVDQGGLLLAGS